MPASSCPQTRTILVIWESSVSARTLARATWAGPRDRPFLFALAEREANEVLARYFKNAARKASLYKEDHEMMNKDELNSRAGIICW
jgi:hypothetical protein